MISINTEVNLNDYHQNAAIVGHVLQEALMKDNGFRYVPKLNEWYLCSIIDKDITLNIKIPLDNPSNIRIDVLDESFCQPYDYQAMIINIPSYPAIAAKCYEHVNSKLAELQEVGIISGFVEGDYV